MNTTRPVDKYKDHLADISDQSQSKVAPQVAMCFHTAANPLLSMSPLKACLRPSKIPQFWDVPKIMFRVSDNVSGLIRYVKEAV